MAETSRTSVCCVRDEPSRSNSPSSSTRSSFGCCDGGTLPTSSRNNVPPSASSKRPMRSLLASVYAPRTWPNISDSNTFSAMPPMLTLTSAFAPRRDCACKACAMTPLPVPFSPSTSTLASLGATRATSSITRRIAGDSAISTSLPPRSSAFSASSRRCRRAPSPSAIWVRTMLSKRVLSHGFSMKSPAPRRSAFTANGTLPHAVITTTGNSGACWRS